MRLIATKLGPTDKSDSLTFLRSDGSSARIPLPRQGILPHDLVHFVVESALPLPHGFLSQVAAGAGAGFAMDSSPERDGALQGAQAVQIEALVEALQTQLWAGDFDAAAFIDGARLACEARGVAAPALSLPDPRGALFDAALALDARWRAVPPHGSLTLDFGRAAG